MNAVAQNIKPTITNNIIFWLVGIFSLIGSFLLYPYWFWLFAIWFVSLLIRKAGDIKIKNLKNITFVLGGVVWIIYLFFINLAAGLGGGVVRNEEFGLFNLWLFTAVILFLYFSWPKFYNVSTSSSLYFNKFISFLDLVIILFFQFVLFILYFKINSILAICAWIFFPILIPLWVNLIEHNAQ